MSAPNIPVHRTMSQNIQVRRATHSCGHARVTARDFLSLQSAHPSACRAALGVPAIVVAVLGEVCSRRMQTSHRAACVRISLRVHLKRGADLEYCLMCVHRSQQHRGMTNVDQKLRDDKSLNYVLYFLKTITSYHYPFYHVIPCSRRSRTSDIRLYNKSRKSIDSEPVVGPLAASGGDN